MSAEFFIGGMLGRIAGPIAQDWFKYKTKLGRELAQRDEEDKIRSSQRDLDNKLKLSKQNHVDKLAELDKQYVDGRKKAEEQMYLSREDWQQKLFWEKCFPLRNPYELPLGYEPVFDETSKRIKGCRLKTVLLPNKRQIVPLRVIVALKDGASQSAATINGELSMFVVNHFSANEAHAIISDIGSWREDAPINDASINYLYTGAKGQPTVVIVPYYINNGSTIRMKVWSWGLGEDLIYPQGYDFGWLDLNAIKRQIAFSEIKKYRELLSKTGLNLPPDAKRLDVAIKKLTLFEKNKEVLSEEDFNRLLELVELPDEIKLSVDKKINGIVTSVFSCLVGMQADNHHLKGFGTLPKLPYILDTLCELPFMYEAINSYYSSILNEALIEGIITRDKVIEVQLALGEAISRKSPNHPSLKEITDNIRLLNADNETNHQEYVRRLRSLTQINNKLLNNA